MNTTKYRKYQRINLVGQVDHSMVESYDRQTAANVFNDESHTVVTIASVGGSVGYARTLYDDLRILQEKTPLWLVARGICFSAGITIAMAVGKERRLATPSAKFLVHEAYRGDPPKIMGPISVREQLTHIQEVDFADDKKENDWVMERIAEGCGQPIDHVKRQAATGLWLVGPEAVEFGMVSGLLGDGMDTSPTI